jgi:hypothetical protein
MNNLVSALTAEYPVAALAATARVENGIFYSYNTPIAVKHEGRYYLTLDKFSKTTTTQQNTLLRELPGALVSVVPQGQIAEIVKYYAI